MTSKEAMLRLDRKPRYEARPYTGQKVWGVYDRALGSWPKRRKGDIGEVAQEVPEPHAKREAERLNRLT